MQKKACGDGESALCRLNRAIERHGGGGREWFVRDGGCVRSGEWYWGWECGYTKATPGCGRGGEMEGGRRSQTYHDTPALGILLIWLSVLT